MTDVLYAFGFDRVGVFVSDLFFIDPEQKPGQEGAEHGVRFELRLLERQELKGSVYSAQPIGVGAPIWRVDLLETVDGPPGSFDRTHHHPRFQAWEPGSRVYEPALSAEPLSYIAGQLADLPGLMERGGFDPAEAGPTDADELRRAEPEIVEATRRLLDRVHAGELGRAPADDAPLVGARVGWL